MKKVLVLVTKSATLGLLDGRRHPSGFWAEEFAVPYELLRAEGYEVDVATVGGVVPVADGDSLNPGVVRYTRPAGAPGDAEDDVAHYHAVLDSAVELRAPRDVAGISREEFARYAGVYVCGGHGAMDDLGRDPDMTRLIRVALDSGRPVASVCHGQSVLMPLRDHDGRWPLEGCRMTAFSHEEELATALAHQLPFVLQVELERLGARYQKASQAWGSCVVVDGTLITGQNPHSTGALADAFLTQL
ncbi:MAG: molecular chaperone [Actinobacteria bacterium 13_1_20CM_3_71_11]|nr:MAG: molecular chaperone [Actinobacteria bacterium 13_1_20CM_3_71_11]